MNRADGSKVDLLEAPGCGSCHTRQRHHTTASLRVEQLGPRGQVMQRMRHIGSAMRLGPGYHNDFVVDGTHAPPHAQLQVTATQPTRLQVRVLSGPAATCGGMPVGPTPVTIASGSTIQWAGASLRVTDAAIQTLEAAAMVPRPHVRGATSPALSAAFSLALAAAGAGLSALADWSNELRPTDPLAFALGQASRSLALLFWPVGWALLAQVMCGTAHWRQHLRLFGLAALVLGASRLVLPRGADALGWPLPGGTADVAYSLALGALVLAHLRHCVRPGRAARWAQAATVVVAALELSIIIARHWPEAGAEPSLAGGVPPGWSLQSPLPAHQVLRELEGVALRADKDRHSLPSPTIWR